MLAIAALLAFVLSFFGVDIDGHDLTDLGLALLAGHLVYPITVGAFDRR